MTCMLILSKKSVDAEGGGIGGVSKVMKEMDTMQQGRDLLTPKEG